MESDIALLLGAVFEEAVHQLGVDEVPGLETVKDPVAAVVCDPAEHGQAGHQHGVIVVSTIGLLTEPDEGGEASEGDQVVAH